MYAIIQLFALVMFVVCFFIPLFWCWGHALSLLVFVAAAASLSHQENQRAMIRVAQGRPSHNPWRRLRLALGVGIIAAIVTAGWWITRSGG